MAFWDAVQRFFAIEGVSADEARSAAPFTVSWEYPDLQSQVAAIRNRAQPWRAPSIQQALAVPGILRCVTLISHTTGSLTMRGYRDGAPMPETPRLLARPDPFSDPYDFYRDTAYQVASRGEWVWWIASRDADGLATALVVVPLRELTIEPNNRNRLRPVYKWGNIESTRWSPANTSGQFVHGTYLREPGELRGRGPLQLAQAAVSVSVEAQEWAANFYGEGGYPSVNMHSETELSPEDAQNLKSQWTGTPPNTPHVTSGDLEIKEFDVNPQGAQMLQARYYQDGEAARMFGMPGTLLEYSSPGSSLTYQNVGEVFNLFIKSCLSPSYLEPIEQKLSDLLPRTQAARFDVAGFLRADIKTRFEVYEKAVGLWGQEDAAQWAREAEGRAAGNVEYAPIPYAPPAAVPSSLPQVRTAATKVELRCDGMRSVRRSGIQAIQRCGKLLSESGTFVGRCPRCKKEYAAA